MPEVILDGEKVDFQGPAPQTAGTVWSLIENYLGSAERLIVSFEVDGRAWNAGGEDVAYDRIDIRSESQVERLAALTETVLSDWDRIDNAWTEIASLSLSVNDDGLKRLGGHGMEVSGNALQVSQFLVAYGDHHQTAWNSVLKAELEMVNSGLSQWMDAFEGKRVIGISEFAANEVATAFGSLKAVLNEASKDLKKRKASE